MPLGTPGSMPGGGGTTEEMMEALNNYAGSGERPGEDNVEVTHTTFLDERPAAEGSGRPMGGGPNAAPRPNVMPEEPFTARDLMKKPVMIRNVQWTIAQTAGTSLLAAGQEIDVPNIINEIPTMQHNILETFAFFKLDLVIRVVVNTSKFHQGRLIISTDPFHQMIDGVPSRSNSQKQWNIFSATMLPSAQIDAARSNVAELFVPWEHIQDYLTTNSKDSFDIMARVRVNVLNPLQTNEGGTTSANVTIFLYAKQISLNVPIYPHTTQIPTLKLELMKRFGMRANGVEDIVGGASKAVSAVASGVSHAANFDIGGLVSDFRGLLGGVNEVVGGFNFDRPAMTAVNYVNMMAPVAPLSHVRGGDTSVRLGAIPKGAYNIHPTFSGTKTAEMDLRRVAAIKGMAEQFTWTTEMAPGTLLRRLPVLPGWCRGDTPNPGGRPRNVNTFLSYVSSFFYYWRGSIEYEFDVVSTMMQTGRLGFAFVPNAIDRSLEFTLDEYSNMPVAYFDLQGGIKRVNITVPWQSSMPRKVVTPVAAAVEANYTDTHILGYLFVFVQNQLAAPSAVPQSVMINEYIGAGPDMEFDVLRVRPETLFLDPPKPSTDEVDEMRANAGCDEPTTEQKQPQPEAPAESAEGAEPGSTICGVDNDLQSRESIAVPRNLLAAGMKQVTRLNAFKEGVLNAKDLARRYSKFVEVIVPFTSGTTGLSVGPDLWQNTGDPAVRSRPTSRLLVSEIDLPVRVDLRTMYTQYDYNYGTWIGGIPPETPEFYAGASSTNLLVSALSKMYAVWSGGIRYKIQPQGNRLTGVNWIASYIMDSAEFVRTPAESRAFGTSTAYPSHTGNFSQNAAAEFEAPFYTAYNQNVTSTLALADASARGAGRVRVQFALDPLENNLPKFENETVVFNPLGLTLSTVPAGTPYLTLHIYVAGGDDIHFGYLVCPPATYSDETIVPPPASALNSTSSQARLKHYRKCMQDACDAFEMAASI